jgi:hypothetical protein
LRSSIHVRGYHGTSAEGAASILHEGFWISRNEYDWLGDGVYFWQDAPRRAWEWANMRYGADAAVVGALIRLDDCMDLLDIYWSRALTDTYNAYLAQSKRARLSLPRQTRGAHRLDRAVINYAVGVLAEQGIVIRSVRAAFVEGTPVYPRSALLDRSHVQIAVRDPSLIEEAWMEGKEETS